MNILIFEQRYTSPAEPGIARFSLFAREWAKQGHQVTVVSGMINYISGEKPEKYRRKLFMKERESENVTVIRVFDSLPGYRTFLGRLLSYFVFMKLASWVGIFGTKADVVVASSPPIFVGFLGFIVSRFKRVPFLFEVRDIWPDEAVELGFLKNKILIKLSHLLEAFLYARAKHIVVNSPGIKEFLVEEKKINEEKIGIVPNPVVVSLGASPYLTREEMGWNDKFVVLYTGAMSAVYDFDTLLDTAKDFASNPSVLFVVVGDGRQKTAIQERAQKEKIHNVMLLPPVSKLEVADLISLADICVAPLKKMHLLRYVYATKLLDYMSGRKPVVLAMEEGASKRLICEEARCGVCVVPGDKEGFKNAILELFNNKEAREKLGDNGYNFARKNFSAEKLAAEYLDTIAKITDAKIIEETPQP